MSLLVVGFQGLTHIGASLARAAAMLDVPCEFCDAGRAFAGPRLLRALSWRLRAHRPPALDTFSADVIDACEKGRPRWLLTTGLAPVNAAALERIGRLGIERINYLTDDPWNRRLSSKWFFDALRHYDRVFTPRRANLADLARHGCAADYLPFGFDPALSFPQAPTTPEESEYFASDVAFVGGADRDRVPYIAALIRSGVQIGIYGSYWQRFPQTRRYARGHANLEVIRKATNAARVSLCLVRRANRDGHVMRSFEIAAMAGCMLVEDTDEHRALFGPPGETAAYFRTIPEMIEQVDWLLSSPTERRRLAWAAYRRILDGRHTYADRLQTMLGSGMASDESRLAYASGGR